MIEVILDAFFVSVRVTLMAVSGIVVVGLPLALFLARSPGRLRHLIEVLILIPMLLPPTVLGYFLLILLGRHSPVTQILGLDLLFTAAGAAVAGATAGLPLMVLAAKAAIGSVDPRLEDVARTLGASELEVLRDITLPLSKRGILAGLLLATARAIGEFGATLMVAGSLPGRTRTLSIALYESIQLGENATAFGLVLVLTAVIGVVIVLLRILERGAPQWKL